MGQHFCHRFGPGRLPFASRRDIGGGIAMAATGLLATVLWFGGAWLFHVTGAASDTLGFFFSVGLFFLPLALPTAFIVGTILWRTAYPEENHQFYGGLFGGITAISSLVAGALGPALFLGIDNVIRGEMVISEAIGFALLLLPVGFLMAIVAAGWIVLPLGIFGGWYHECAKTHSNTVE